jgi:hypothetical protein
VDQQELESLAEQVRSLGGGEASDDEIAMWLKERTLTFAESAKVLALAEGIETVEAYVRLDATETWQASTACFHTVDPAGAIAEFRTRSGRTFVVGDTFNMPNAPEPPYKAEPGRGTVWRITAVEPDEDANFTARLVVEPIRRLAPPT